MRVLVEVLHVGVGGSVIEVEVVLLDVFAVVSFSGGEAEGSFLQNGILAVP